MPPEIQPPAVSAKLWDDDDPRHDRAAGAWLGAAAAARIVGSPTAMVKGVAHPDGHETGPALLSWLIVAALRHLDNPGEVAKAADTAPGHWRCGALSPRGGYRPSTKRSPRRVR